MPNESVDNKSAPTKEEERKIKTSVIDEEPSETMIETDYQGKSNASEDEDGTIDKIPFPVLLHGIVCNPATDHCIHWLPDRNQFTISDKNKFAKEVLPTLNGNAKFTSFTRRLKRWGFTRIASGPQIGAYENPDFAREEPERCRNIKYMHPKPLSRTAIDIQNSKFQAANMNFTIGGGAFRAQPPTQDLRMLETLIARRQQMGMQMSGQANPMEAYMRLATGDSNSTAMSAPAANLPKAMQLAMLQEMQSKHKIQQQQQHVLSFPVTASATPKGESYGEKIARTNPALAAQLIEAKSVNSIVSQGIANPPNSMIAMLAGHNLNQRAPQQNVINALLHQMGNQEVDQQSVITFMLGLLQQEQQQQQLKQQTELIKSFTSEQTNQQQDQVLTYVSRGSVTPSNSSPNL